MYYKLGQACIKNWGGFVLLQINASVVINWGSFNITNWGKIYYKLALVLQIREIITNSSITPVYIFQPWIFGSAE